MSSHIALHVSQLGHQGLGHQALQDVRMDRGFFAAELLCLGPAHVIVVLALRLLPGEVQRVTALTAECHPQQ
jgi:hypothetical protein